MIYISIALTICAALAYRVAMQYLSNTAPIKPIPLNDEVIKQLKQLRDDVDSLSSRIAMMRK